MPQATRKQHRYLNYGLAVIAMLAIIGAALYALLEVLPMIQRTRDADFYVAPTGSDDNPGTRTAPFATLERARDAVRELIDAGLDKNVKVYLRGGTYYLPEGITFGPKDSGTETYGITYAAYPGEAPVLMGGVPVTVWEPYRGEIVQAAIPEGFEPRQVFENGERLDLARTPDTGYLEIEGPVSGQPRTAFTYREGDLQPEDWDITEARVFIWPGHDWFSQDKEISQIDPEERVITMASAEGYDMRSGNRYYIQNVLALLDRPGECVISNKARNLYVWPQAGRVEDQEIVLSTAENILRIRGSGSRPVRNLHIEGLDLSIANGDAVRISGAEDCSVRFSKIENAADVGAHVDGYAQRITIYGNLVQYNGWHGVHLEGLAPGQPDVNHHNVVENNHIRYCGQLVGHGYGVRIYQSGHNHIVHNHIHHMPRYGTTIKGLRYQVLREQVLGVTWENHYDYLHSRHNTLAYNHIHHVNLDSQDTGAMESWGPGRDNVYDHNLIHDTGNTQFDLQSGIYLDDASDHFTVTNNLIYNVTGTGGDQCIFTKGIGNKIHNNILIPAPTNTSAISSLYMAEERCDNHTYTQNIIAFEVSDKPSVIPMLYNFRNWSDDRVSTADRNLIWAAGKGFAISGGSNFWTFDRWREMGYDAQSVIADPRFADAANRDYSLAADSPALDLGFEPIDVSEIGLTDDFPARFPRD